MNTSEALPDRYAQILPILTELPDVDDQFWQAILRRERGTSADAFVYAVKSTGVYCRAYCPSKRPDRKHVSFYKTPNDAEAAGFRACLRCHPKAGEMSGEQAILRACKILDARFDESLPLRDLAKEVGLSPEYLQRAFKRVIGVSPREYASARRMERFRMGLQHGEAVGEALFEAGYSSTSRIYGLRKAELQLGASPSEYKKQRLTLPVRYVTGECHHGHFIIAATERGVCSIALGSDALSLTDSLQREYPLAAPAECGNASFEMLTAAAAAIMRHLSGLELNLRLPLDVRATAFQRQVWQALQAIPYGETRSYTDIADFLGKPTAARAVAGACASNPVALVVPCHRVVRSGGEISGYRWGVERKAALLASEREVKAGE